MIKIYTKTGDKGTTGLTNGERVLKNELRIEAYGTVDELNCVIGLCLQKLDHLSKNVQTQLQTWLFAIQNDLFNLGSDLATPISSRFSKMKIISADEITQLEKIIDICQETLPELREFVLPGGTIANAHLHLARTVCRRAERCVVALAQTTDINPDAVKYLNRLSDLFFVLARYVQHEQNTPEVTWKKDGGVCGLKST